LANIERGALFAALLGRLAQVNVLTPKGARQRLRLGVSLADTLRQAVVHRQSLRQHKQVFLAPLPVSALRTSSRWS